MCRFLFGETFSRKERILLRNYVLRLQRSASAFLSSGEAQDRAPSTGNRILSKQFEVLQRDTSLREFCGQPSNFLPLSMIPSRTCIKSAHSFTFGNCSTKRFIRRVVTPRRRISAYIDHYQKEFYTPISKHKSTDAKGVAWWVGGVGGRGERRRGRA